MTTEVASHSAAEPEVVGHALVRTVAERMLVLLVGLELVVLYAPTIRWLIDRWSLSVWHNAHGFLIPPLVAYFAWQELRPLRGQPRAASAWGFAFLLPAIAAHVLDTGIHTQILSAVSICLALPGLSLLFLGTRRTRAIAFPLAFMAFMLPIPLALTERLHFALRNIATVITAHLLPLFNITVYSEGTTLYLADTTLFVGDGCSGFSTLYASIAVAALAAYSATSTRGRILPLVAAAPIAIAANAMRVVLLAVLVHSQGAPVLDTWLHPASGMLTFALALPIIMWLGSLKPAGTRA